MSPRPQLGLFVFAIIAVHTNKLFQTQRFNLPVMSAVLLFYCILLASSFVLFAICCLFMTSIRVQCDGHKKEALRREEAVKVKEENKMAS